MAEKVQEIVFTEAEKQKITEVKRYYDKEWRRKNPDKVRMYRNRFYLKKWQQLRDEGKI